MLCNACGHEHRGVALASICIGCPCPERPDAVTESARSPHADSAGICDCPECSRADGADEEVREVVAFLRRHDADQVLGIKPPPLADLIAQLERGEHRR